MPRAHFNAFLEVSASLFPFPLSILLIIFLDSSFYHFHTLFMGFRKDDDFGLFSLDQEFSSWGLVLGSIRDGYL